jgi:hypothetical protein
MGFTTENIPYSLSIGLDVTNLMEDLNQEIIIDTVYALDENSYDYIVSHVSSNDRGSDMTKPIFIDDYIMNSYYWKTKFVAKIHNEDMQPFNDRLAYQDMEYAYHLNTKGVIIDNVELNNLFIIGKMIKRYLHCYPDRQICINMDFNEDGLFKWKQISNIIECVDNVHVMLKVLPDLPSNVYSV